MNAKLLWVALIGSVTLVPQVAMADFCSILKFGNQAQAQECRTNGKAGGAEFYGNWAILSVQGTNPKTGQKGQYRTAMMPSVSGEWKVSIPDVIPYFTETCFLGKRKFSLTDGNLLHVNSTSTKPVLVSLDGGSKVHENWIVDANNLAVPPDSVVIAGFANASKMTLVMPLHNFGGQHVRDQILNYETDGYSEASEALCK